MRYFAFALFPTIIISAFVLSWFLNNYQIQHLEFFGLLIGLIHSLSTNGLALVKLVSHNKTVQAFFNKYFQMFMHLFSILMISLSGYLGGILGEQKFLVPFIPTMGVMDNLWAALFSSVLTVFLYRIYTNRHISEREIIVKSKDSLSASLVNYINEVCDKYSAKRELVMAICITENIQRPAWVRKLEKIKSLIFKQGTYGLMQIQSDHYIDDFTSVDLAVGKFFKYSSVSPLSSLSLTESLSKYNSDPRFIQFATAAFYDLQPKG